MSNFWGGFFCFQGEKKGKRKHFWKYHSVPTEKYYYLIKKQLHKIVKSMWSKLITNKIIFPSASTYHNFIRNFSEMDDFFCPAAELRWLIFAWCIWQTRFSKKKFKPVHFQFHQKFLGSISMTLWRQILMKLKTHRFELVLGLPALLRAPPKDAPPESCLRTEKIIHFQEFAADKGNLLVKWTV